MHFVISEYTSTSSSIIVQSSYFLIICDRRSGERGTVWWPYTKWRNTCRHTLSMVLCVLYRCLWCELAPQCVCIGQARNMLHRHLTAEIPQLTARVVQTNEVRAVSWGVSAVRCHWCMFFSCPIKMQRGACMMADVGQVEGTWWHLAGWVGDKGCNPC
jgi:hypothetical protein